MLTLLQMVQRAQAELGLPQATSVIGNADPTTQQMLALSNRVLDELRRSNPTGWTAMQFEYDLVVPVPITVTGNLSTPFTNTISGITGGLTGVVANYFSVSGNTIPQGARVQSVNNPNSIVLTPAPNWTVISSGTGATVVMNMEAVNSDPVMDAEFVFSQDTFPEPVGFDWFQNRTMWDRTNRWELIGPDSPQIDQWHRSGIVVTGPRRHFRQVGPFGNNFRIWPPPVELTSPLQLVFEYMSTNAVNVNNSGTTFAQYFTSDNDTPLLDDQAIIMGIKWMFWEIKGMGSYVTLQQRWLDYVDRLIARDGAAPTLQLAKRVSPIFLSPANVPDGFFPGPMGPGV